MRLFDLMRQLVWYNALIRVHARSLGVDVLNTAISLFERNFISVVSPTYNGNGKVHNVRRREGLRI